MPTSTFPMPRITFAIAFGRCALAWEDAGVAGFELPEAEVRSKVRLLTLEGAHLLAEL